VGSEAGLLSLVVPVYRSEAYLQATVDELLAFFAQAVDNGFIKKRQVDALVVSDDVDTLLDGVVGAVRPHAPSVNGQ